MLDLGILGIPAHSRDSLSPGKISSPAILGGSSFSNPAGLLAEAGESNFSDADRGQGGDGGDSDEDGEEDVGIASRAYFDRKASPTTTYSEFLQSAEIMKLITEEEWVSEISIPPDMEPGRVASVSSK